MEMKILLVALIIIATGIWIQAEASFPECMSDYYDLADEYQAKGWDLEDLLLYLTDTTEYNLTVPCSDLECEITARIEQYWNFGIKGPAPAGSYYGQADERMIKTQ